MPRFVITGTDTDIGKTVFAAALTRAMGAAYWKPVQAGTDGGTDPDRLAALGVPAEQILPEAYRLATPCSPHQAAAIDGVKIDPARLAPPAEPADLVIEGAGGVLVPVTPDLLYADLFAQWQLPVILVARTALGTINHSLLSIEALRYRGVIIHGIAFIGDENAETQNTIARLGDVDILGRLPHLPVLTADNLQRAFAEHFDMGDFA